MPNTPALAATPFRYGNHFHNELITSALQNIVYTSEADFADRIFPEFDKIIAGEPSAVLTELTALYSNQDLYVDPNPEQEGHISLAEFQELIKQRLLEEMVNFADDAARKARLRWQAERARQAQRRLVAPVRTFPTPTDLALMDKYGIPHTTRPQEFRVCVAIQILLSQLKYVDLDSLDYRKLDEFEQQINAIYTVLDMPHEANAIRDWVMEKYSLRNLLALFAGSALSITDFTTFFDSEARTLFCKYGNTFIKEIKSLASVNMSVLQAYVKCRQLLAVIDPAFAYGDYMKIFAQGDLQLPINAKTRDGIIELFANFCEIDLTACDNQQLLQKLIYLLVNIVNFAIPYQATLPDIYNSTEESVIYCFYRYDEFKEVVTQAKISAAKILNLPVTTLALVFLNLQEIIQQCSMASLKLEELFSLPSPHIIFILSNPLYLPRIAVLRNYYGLDKDIILHADLSQLKAWIMQPSLAARHSTMAETERSFPSIDEFATFAGEELYVALVEPEKDYDFIQNYFLHREYASCNSMQTSVYAFALKQNDPRLIEIISSSIYERSKTYLNVFLMRHGFKIYKPENSTLPGFSGQQQTCTQALKQTNNQGKTPLQIAIEVNDVHAVLALLVRGVSVNELTTDGCSALDLAETMQHQQILKDVFFTSQIRSYTF